MIILKLKVLFFKRKHIYYVLFVLIVLIFCAFSILSSGKSSYITFNSDSNIKNLKSDLNGDGKEDTLYILTSKNNRYHLQINTFKNTFNLKPNKEIATLGSNYPYWPIRVKLKDISRNSIPEIFVQSSQDNVSIQHIFTYKDNEFKDIFCSYNNILGFIDCSNNKTPKILSAKIYGDNFYFENYMFIDNKLEKYSNDINDTFMGKDTILCFVNIITSMNGKYMPTNENIFYQGIDSSSLDLLPHLAGYAHNYVFQDAFFMDTKSDNSGEPTNIEWTLNFKGNPTDYPNKLKNYTLKLNLLRCKNCKEKYYYKIISFQLTN
ncbi:hypothetical protein [Clostridium massiliodielmoense]|uniref:hypothetical protein n=1 Tax=Clostridium massiliodielmoense TaxID=1776385 RepID=UPI000A26A427|nr:hypothetical protein [Clostridium massiliodielmoense]